MNPLITYRNELLRGVSDRTILTRAGEGDLRNLWKLKGDPLKLRQKLSQTLGAFEREAMGGVNAPEWTTGPHNIIKEVFARTIETQPCPVRL